MSKILGDGCHRRQIQAVAMECQTARDGLFPLMAGSWAGVVDNDAALPFILSAPLGSAGGLGYWRRGMENSFSTRARKDC